MTFEKFLILLAQSVTDSGIAKKLRNSVPETRLIDVSDSIGLVEIQMGIEEELGVSVDCECFTRDLTIQELHQRCKR